MTTGIAPTFALAARLSMFSLLLVSSPYGVAAPSAVVAHESVIESKTIPAIGATHSTETGESMYSEVRIRKTQTYTVVLDEEATGSFPMGRAVELPVGFKAKMMKMDTGQRAVCWELRDPIQIFAPPTGCVFDKGGSGVFDTSTILGGIAGVTSLKTPAKYRTLPDPVAVSVSEPNFKREVLYHGVSKGTLKISFREFVNDMARPSYTQEIAYDLESDGTTLIAFKGLRVKVLKATSSMVDYQLLAPFADSSTK